MPQHTHTHTHMHQHMYAGINTCMCSHVCLHTHTHTLPPSLFCCLSLSFIKVQFQKCRPDFQTIRCLKWMEYFDAIQCTQLNSGLPFSFFLLTGLRFYYQLMSVMLLKWTHWYQSVLQVYFSIKTGMIPLESIVIFIARAGLILWQMWVTVITRFIVLSVVPPSKGRKKKRTLLSWNWGEITEFWLLSFLLQIYYPVETEVRSLNSNDSPSCCRSTTKLKLRWYHWILMIVLPVADLLLCWNWGEITEF